MDPIIKYVTYDKLLVMMQDGNQYISVTDSRFPADIEIHMDRASYLKPHSKHYLVTAEQMVEMRRSIELAAEANIECKKLHYQIESLAERKSQRHWQSKYENLKLMYNELQHSTVSKHKYDKLLAAFNKLKEELKEAKENQNG